MTQPPVDLVNFTKQYKAELEEFFLDLTSWRKFRSAYQLVWKKVRFDSQGRKNVPDERGLYAFTLELTPSALPPHGYILYVGITGQDSKGTLNSRYRQYERERDQEKGRPRIVYMLKKWAGDIHFNFAPISDAKVNLKDVERSFLDAVIPPMNSADFSADIVRARKAAL